MREIYLGTKHGTLHPCEIEYLKHDFITDKYYIYVFDRALNDYCYAEVLIKDGKYWVKEIDYRSYEGILHALASLAMPKLDITKLPPVIPYYKVKKKDKTNLFISRSNGSSISFVKRLEFLEVESYCNALRDTPEYYYFIVNNMLPNLASFEYNLTFACKSDEPLKKNIIARHKTVKSLNDFPCEEDFFTVVFPYNDDLNINIKYERALVEKIMKLEENRRKNMDPILLTKVVRMMVAQDDYIKAAQDYQTYLTEYYDKWIQEEQDKHL